MSETPDYTDYTAELTDYAIEQSAQGEHAQPQFDLNKEDRINPALFDDMNARRESAVEDARNLAISGFESEQATLTPQMELKTTNEYVAGIASMSFSLVNARNVQLGLVTARQLNTVPFEAQQRQPAASATPYQQQNSNVVQFPQKPTFTRSYEDPQGQDYFNSTAA